MVVVVEWVVVWVTVPAPYSFPMLFPPCQLTRATAPLTPPFLSLYPHPLAVQARVPGHGGPQLGHGQDEARLQQPEVHPRG